MVYYVAGLPYSDELYHSGTKGQKWGLRRYQNPDGSLTPLGRIHYGIGKARERHALEKRAKEIDKHPERMTDEERKEILEQSKRERLNKQAMKEVNDAYEVRRKGFKKDPSSLTKNEINEQIERMRLEKQYKDALKELESKSLKGKMKDLAEDMIKSSLKTAAQKIGENVGQKIGMKIGDNLTLTPDEIESRTAKMQSDLYINKKSAFKQKEEYDELAKRNNKTKEDSRSVAKEDNSPIAKTVRTSEEAKQIVSDMFSKAEKKRVGEIETAARRMAEINRNMWLEKMGFDPENPYGKKDETKKKGKK